MRRRDFLRFAAIATLPGVTAACAAGAAADLDGGIPTKGLTTHVHLFGYRDGARPEPGTRIGYVNNSASSSIAAGLQQQNPGNQPTMFIDADSNRPSLQFDGGASLTSQRAGLTASCTIVAVLSADLKRGAGTVLASSSRDGLQLRIAADGMVELVRATYNYEVRSTVPVPDSGASVVMCIVDESEFVQFLINGTPAGYGVGTADYAARSLFEIGSFGGSDYFHGLIGELLVWDRALSGYELRSVSDSLSSSWKITTRKQISALTFAPLAATGVKGSNIMPKAVDITDAAWRNLWVGWDWPWIKNSVDKAVALSANAIRIVGDVEGVHSGRLSVEKYLEQLEQLADYCSSQDCRLYYCLLDVRHMGVVPPEFVASFAERIGGVLAGKANVLAIEIANEISTAYDSHPREDVAGWVGMWSASLRRAAPKVPLSISDVRTGTLFEKTNDVVELNRYAQYVDFYDLHMYYPPETDDRSNVLAAYEFAVDRPMMVGEMGADRDDRSLDPGRTYKMIEKVCASSPAVVGVFQWAAVNDRFGLYSETTGLLQDDIADAWRNFEVGK